jgi:hypothetical protein
LYARHALLTHDSRLVRRNRRRYNGALADVCRVVDVTRVRIGARSIDVDRMVTEETLEVGLHNQRFAVIVRAPGADRDLLPAFCWRKAW